jgi:hypothetical protein
MNNDAVHFSEEDTICVPHLMRLYAIAISILLAALTPALTVTARGIMPIMPIMPILHIASWVSY